MYSVTVKGRDLNELKKAVSDIHQELQQGVVGGKVVKDLDVSLKEEMVKPAVEVNVPATQAPVGDVEVDSEGLPWDKRIHASSRNTVKDGTWRIKRGVSDEVVKEVKDELRQRMQQRANPTPVPQAPITQNTPVVNSPVVPIVESSEPAPTLQAAQAPVVEQPPVVEPVAQQSAPALNIPTMGGGHTLHSFKENMPMVITNLISEGKIDQDYINQLKGYFQVDQIWNINDQQKSDLFDNFVQHGLIVKVG